MNAKWKENVYKWKEDERTWMHIGMNMKGIGKENEWKCIPIKGTWQENERKWMHNERRMHAWKDLEYSDFHKTLESDRAPPKAITITLATTQRNLTGVHIYIYIYTCYIYICYVYIYIYTWLIFGAPSKRRNGSLLQDYLVSGAAGYVSFCQGAPDNVLDGTLAVSLEGTESCL